MEKVKRMTFAVAALALIAMVCISLPIDDADAAVGIGEVTYNDQDGGLGIVLTDIQDINVIVNIAGMGMLYGSVDSEGVVTLTSGIDLEAGRYSVKVTADLNGLPEIGTVDLDVVEVNLHDNGKTAGEFSDTVMLVSADHEWALPTTDWEKDGSVQIGWSTSSVATAGVTSMSFTTDTDLYAIYGTVPTFTVTIQSDGNGTVSPESVQAAPGTTVTVGTGVNLGSLSIGEEPVTTTPTQGFEFDMWTVASGEYNGGTVTGDMTITAVFSKIQYEIDVTGNSGGEIESSDESPITVDYGTQITVVGNVLTVGNYTFEAIADGDHEFDMWTVASGEYNGGTVTGDMTITAMFVVVDPDTFSVTVQTVGDGTASADPISQIPGGEVTLSYVPGNGNEFKEWQVISGGITIEEDRFTMGNQDVIVKAIFVPIEYDVTVDPVEGGTVTVSTTSAEHGSDVTVTVVANDNKVISDIVIGYPTPTLGAISPYDGLVEYTYVIEDVTSEVVVSVTFRDALLYHILLTESGEAETFDVYEGRDMTVPVEPPFGYIVGSAKVDGESIRVVDAYDFVYTFEDIRQNHTLAVTFTIDPSIDDDEEESPITPNPDTGSDKGGKDNTVAIVAIAAGAVVAALVAVFALRKD